MEKLYTVDGVAELTGLTGRTIRNYIADGRLKGRKIGSQWRFTEGDIMALFDSPVRRAAETLTADDAAPAAGYDVPAEVADFLGVSGRETASACAVIDLPVDERAGAEVSRRVEDAAAGFSGEAPRVTYSYDEDSETARIIISGPLDLTAKLIKVIRKG